MKKRYGKKALSILVTLSILISMITPATIMFASSEAVFPIGFEAVEGYAPGDVSGQPSTAEGTKWTADAPTGTAMLEIVDGAGADGGQALVAPSNHADLPANHRLQFIPSAAELGAETLPGIKVSYSFDLLMNDAPDGTAANVWTIGVGTGANPAAMAARLQVRSNGKLAYGEGTSNLVAKNASGTDLVLQQGQWVTISGVLDFTAHTYTLTIDGVQQVNANSEADIAFRTGTLNAFYSFMLMNMVAGSDANYRPIGIDNLSLARVTDEPGPGMDGEAYVLYTYDFEDGTLPAGWPSTGSSGSEWAVIQDPDDADNYVFARTMPAFSQGTVDATSYKYAFGHPEWTDYIFNADVKPRSELTPISFNFGIMGRYVGAGTELDTNNRTFKFNSGPNNFAYQAFTGRDAFYAGTQVADGHTGWRSLFARFDDTRNYLAADGQLTEIAANRYSPEYYAIAGGTVVLGPSNNQQRYDDSTQSSSMLSPVGQAGFAERRGWAIYDNVTLRVKETINELEAAAADGTPLGAPLLVNQVIPLVVEGRIADPFDGIEHRQIDTNLTEIIWQSSDPEAISVSEEGVLRALAPNAQATITYHLEQQPGVAGQLVVQSGSESLENLLERIEIADYGSIVDDATVRMFAHDELEIGRVLRVGAHYTLEEVTDVSGEVDVALDSTDGSNAKAIIDQGVLTLTEQAVAGDRIHLNVVYEEDDITEEAVLTIEVKPDIPMDVLSMYPYTGVIFLDTTLNLDTFTTVYTGSKPAANERIGPVGQVTGFVDFTLEHGADIAELNGSILSLKANAEKRDSIIIGFSYTAEGPEGPVTLTNELKLQVVDSIMQGGEDVYDPEIVNGASPDDILTGMQIVKDPVILSNPPELAQSGVGILNVLPMLKGQSLNLSKELRITGYYDNPNNRTRITNQVAWSVETPAGGQPAAQITTNSSNEKILSFVDPSSQGPAVGAVIQASYQGVQQSFEVAGIQAERLVLDQDQVDLVDGEAFHLADHARARIAGSYDGTEYMVDVPGDIEWTVHPDDTAKAALVGDELSFLQMDEGDEVRLQAHYVADPSVTATLTVRLVEQLQIQIDTSTFTEYNHNIMGFNDMRWGGNANGYSDPEITELVKPLKPGVMRFPGGTRANYYRWEIGGYINETLAAHSKNGHQFMINDPQNNLEFTLDHFMAFVEEVGAEPLVVVNLYTADTDSIVELLKYSKSQGYDIKYWELGNEMHLQGGGGAPHRNAFPTVQDYARKAKEVSMALKAIDPDIETIVIGERYLGAQGLEADEMYMLRWSEGLMEDASYYDIISNHWYWYINHYPSDIAYHDEVKAALTVAPGIIRYDAEHVAERYPGKKIAFTEWGILPDNQYKTNKTLLNALFDADIVLNMVKYDNIAFFNRHNLAANNFEVIGFKGAPTANSHEPVKRASYHTFELLGSLFDVTDERADVEVQHNKYLTPVSPYEEMVPVLDVSAFRNSADDTTYLAAINKGEVDKPVEISLDEAAVQQPVRMKYVTGETLTDGSGDPIYTLQRNNGGVLYPGTDFLAPKPLDGTQEVTIQEVIFQPGDSIVIPRYSVAILELLEGGTEAAEAYVVYEYDFEDGLPAGWNTAGTSGSEWGIVSDPTDAGNHVFTRTSSANQGPYFLPFGAPVWTDYTLEADIMPVEPPAVNSYFGLVGRFGSADAGQHTSNRKSTYFRGVNGYSYRTFTGTDENYASSATQAADAFTSWRTFLVRYDGGKNYFSAGGQLAQDVSQRFSLDYYVMNSGTDSLSPSRNGAKYDDAGQNPSKLAAQGQAGLVEKQSKAYYDNIIVRVKESINEIEIVSKEENVSLTESLVVNRPIQLAVQAALVDAFDGVMHRPIDDQLTRIEWISDNPEAAEVGADGGLTMLETHSSAVITARLYDAPHISFSVQVSSGSEVMQPEVVSLSFQNFGAIVEDQAMAMFPHDELVLNRVLRVDAEFSQGMKQDVTAEATIRLNEADGSHTKASITNGRLILDEAAVPGSEITLLAEYTDEEDIVHSATLAIEIKQPVDIEVIAMKPNHGLVGLNDTLNLDLATSVYTGNKSKQFDNVSGFVDWSIKAGSDIAELDGSLLTIFPNAQPRDSIIVQVAYEVQTVDGTRTLTNEFHVEVAHELMPGGEDEYDESNVNQASPYDVLQGLRFEQKQYILDELYIRSGASLNLYRDIKVRGVYDNLLNSTQLTSQVAWSLEQDPAEPIGELVMNSQNQPVLRFIGQNAELTEGTVVIRATYNDISHAIPVHFVQPEQLVIEPAALKLLPEETLHLRDHVRARLTGTYEGSSYSLEASALVDWSIPAQYQSLVELDGNLVSFPSAETGDAAALAAAYDAEVQLQAELAIEIVPSLQLRIDPALAQDYHNDLLGYNDNRWGVNASRYTEQSIIDLTMPLKPAYIRFPGGSRGNYYQWQIEGYIPHILSNPNDLANYQNMIDDPYSQGIISIDDFIAYTDEVGAEPIVQLNPYTADVDSAVGFLEYTLQQGYEVKYWEIGNELSYLGGAGAPYRVAFPTVEDYIRKAKEFALALKAVDPTINIIVVGPKFFSIYGDEPDNEFNRDWAQKLGQEDFYEIVVYHLYWQNLYDVAEVDYFEEIHIGMRRAQPQIEDMARALQHYFPGKQAAITEWGILRDNTRVSKTLFNVLYDAESILNFTQYDNIAITNRHVLATNQYELIGYTGTPASNSHEATIRAPYYAFQLMAELFEAADQRIEAQIESGKQLVPDEYAHARMIPELLTTAFKDSATGKLYVAAVNKSGVDKPIDVIIEADNRSYRAEMRYITGETITDEHGNNIFTLQNNNGGVKYKQSDFLADIPMDLTQHVYTQALSYEANTSWVIPRYSVAVLELIEVETQNPGQGPIWAPPGPPANTPPGKLDGRAIASQRIEQAGGRPVLHAEIDGKQLGEAIKQLSQIEDKRLLIALDTDGDELELSLPLMELVEAAANVPSAVLVIVVEGASYELPLAAFDLPGLVGQGIDSADAAARLSVKIGQAPDNAQQQLQAAANEAGAQLLVPGIRFEVIAETSAGSIELQPSGGRYLARGLQLPETADWSKAAGVWLDPSNGELAFVPTVFELRQGADWASMKRPGNSVYTVVQLQRTYSDIAGHWAQEQIEQLASKLIIKGRSEQSFAPGDSVTRAEFTALLVRALGLGGVASESLPDAPRFTDVPDGAWYEATVATAAAAGLVQGYEDGSFRPTAAISRQQMAVMLVRALHVAQAGVGGELPAVDAAAGTARLAAYADDAALAQWSREAVAEALQRGLMNGVSEARFDPKSETTRAQAAAALQRMLAMLGFIGTV